MITMTTRSSRFFVVLVHLLGVSTHIPSSGGIVGVHPLSVMLETLDPALLESDDKEAGLLHGQPYWIQDVLGDQACLDPMGGFSECGDSTLWLVIPKKSSKRQAIWRKWITWATEEEETEENTSNKRIQGYALQLFDESHHQFEGRKKDESYPYRRQHSPTANLSERECLTRRRRDNKLVLASCSQDRAWAWHFNENGILHFKKQKGGSPPVQTQTKHKRLLKKHEKKYLECLGRSHPPSKAIIVPCNGLEPPPGNIDQTKQSSTERILQVALVRQVTSETSFKPSEPKRHAEEVITALPQEDNIASMDQPSERKFPPSRIDIAHSHASASQKDRDHMGWKTGGARISSLPTAKSTPTTTKIDATTETETIIPLNYFKYSNPIMFAHDHLGKHQQPRPLDTKGREALTSTTKTSGSVGGNINAKLPPVRKIQTNPYITEAVNEQWTDPQTNLVFRTDLCKYLGHERADVGRHTLTGVGQFMKTVFNIKVYGVAFYVSKRDILADPVMEHYASMSTKELREDPAFYETLRFMTPSDNPSAGTFDRTLFLKTNMQLATDTMRSSLDADWKMLTQADKDLLIGSSMKARPASDAMMAVIQSPDNPSKCSCAQIAPEEVGADPSCCARGTELVFTWRKSGALEVRLNGVLMDSFDRPDIAAAIFYEYLRLDDPMSSDFIERVVDGFPMLLGPLSQVKGFSSPSMSHTAMSTPKTSAVPNVFTRALDGVGGAVISGASNVAGLVQHGAAEIGNGAAAAARSMGDAARNLGEELEQRRQLIGKHVGHFAHQTVSTIYSGGKDQKVVAALPKWLETMPVSIPIQQDISDARTKEDRSRRKISWLSKVLGVSEDHFSGPCAPDEIVPMIHPSATFTQRFFLGMVHLYLLLILIVSFPANLSTRTKLVASRKSNSLIVQPLSDSDSEEGSSVDGSSSSLHDPSSPKLPFRKSNRGFSSSFGRRQGSRMQNSL